MTGASAGLMLGTAVEDITPSLGHALGGWPDERRAALVHAPLEARVLYLASDTTVAVVAALDLLGMSSELCGRLREAIAHELGVDRSSVLLSCTHTHSGPVLPPWRSETSPEPDEAYLERLGNRLVAAARRAASSSIRVKVGHGSAMCDLGVSRRLPWDDGRIGYPPHADPQGPVDRSVDVLRFDSLDGVPHAVLFSYGCHPTVGGPTAWIGPDYPGAARREIESCLTSATAVFVMGNCGDVRANYTNPDGSFRWDVTTELVDEAGRRLGAVAADVATRVRTEPMAQLQVGRASRDVHTLDDQLLETSEFVAIRIGEAAIVSNPAECFCEIGIEVRAAARVPLLFSSVTNGFFGYVATRDAYPHGGYEVELSWRAFGLPAPVRPDAHDAFRDGMLEALVAAGG